MEDINLNNLAVTVSRLENTINFLNTRIAYLEMKIAEYDLAFEVISQNIDKQADTLEESRKAVKEMLGMSKKVHDILTEENEAHD